MKRATRNRWEAHVPATNVFWVQYLVDTCMQEVGSGYSFTPQENQYNSCPGESGAGALEMGGVL
jgi:hypothetical protein